MRKRQPRLAAARRAFLTALGNSFFKSVLSRNVALRMERSRHQLAPAMPGQKTVDCAVAGFVHDGLFVCCLDIVDVQHFARPGGLGKTFQQDLFLSQRHVLALAPAAWLASQRLEPAVVIGHVGPVHRAQRHSHRFRNRRLRHSALTQQHHLDALALRGVSFPMQRCFQTPNLLSGASNHLLLRIKSDQMVSANHTRPTNAIHIGIRCFGTANIRFNPLWKRYKRGKSRGIGMIIRFSRRRESDSVWACRRLRILTV
jgi:hypothetical protein